MSLNLHSFGTSHLVLTGLATLQFITSVSANSGSIDSPVAVQGKAAPVQSEDAATAEEAATAAVDTATTVAKTLAAAKDTATELATTAAATKAQTEVETTAAAAASASVTYNQWGFTGSQSIWEAPTLATSKISGSSASSAIPTIKPKNTTSNANRVQSSLQEASWKKMLLLGGVVGVSAVLSM